MKFGFARKFISLLESFLPIDPAFAQVTGDKINRGAGNGLEVPCVYRRKVILTR